MSQYSQKILIVEDEQTLLKAMSFSLEDAGFPVETAMDGEEALVKIKEKPDLVLLDIILPRKNGLDVLKEMQADQELKSIPVLLLTNLSDDESVGKGVELGARGYLVKANYDLEDVVKKVKSILNITD